MPPEVTLPPPLRKVAPLRLPRRLVDAIHATATAMQSPMCPHVSISWAARELITRGCAELEERLARGQTFEWSVASPPRGHRRSKGVTPRDPAPGEDFVLTAPLSLPEPLLERIEQIQHRCKARFRTRISLAALLREAISLGHEARERERQRRLDDAHLHAEILRRAGVYDPSQIVTAMVPVVSPYMPPGPRNPWASGNSRSAKRRVSRPQTPNPTTLRSVSRARKRAPRKKTARKADRTDGSDDDGSDAPPHADRHEHPTSGSATPSRTLTDTDRRFLDYLIEEALRA